MQRPLNYSASAIGLHWTVACLIFLNFPLGLYMSGLLLSPDKLRLFSYHKWIGATIFLLAVLRVVLRLARSSPALPATLPAWQRRSATTTHWLLYGLIVCVPLSGWLLSSAQGFQTVLFTVVPLPDLVGKDKVLASTLMMVHAGLNFFMMGLVGLHLLAALQHHFILRDGVLARMIPWLR